MDSIIGSPANFIDIEQSFESVEITLLMEGHSGISLKNLVNMIYSKQTLKQKALGIEGKLIDKDLVTRLGDQKPETPEKFITFNFAIAYAEQTKACSELIAFINQKAKTLKHVSSKPSKTDNELRSVVTSIDYIGRMSETDLQYLITQIELIHNSDSKELMKLTLEKRTVHGGNPVLRWMMDNIYVKTDPAGNIKPDKEKSTEKIDGAVALNYANIEQQIVFEVQYFLKKISWCFELNIIVKILR